MPEPRAKSDPSMNRRLKLVATVAAVAAVLIVGAGAFSRVLAHRELKTWNEAQAIPTVALASLRGGDDSGGLLLPGEVQAFTAAPIHARVSGYLKRWYVDIGAPVKAGQLLAEVETPDLDQQLSQARADLATATANQQLAVTTAKRWQGLLADDAVSHQEADEKNGDLAAKTALVNSALANVRRLEALSSFKRITAPFAGVVTARNTDVGQLIADGSPTSTPLFIVSDESRLRVYVRVPQGYIARVRPGMTATLTVPEHPGRTFTATLQTTADAIGAGTGAQLTQLWIGNADHSLTPGEYAQVKFDLPAAPGSLRVPASAITNRHDGMAVAVVGPNSRVLIKPLIVTRDLGSAVEVAGGVTLADRVIDNPIDTLQAGDLVRVAGASAEARARPGEAARHG